MPKQSEDDRILFIGGAFTALAMGLIELGHDPLEVFVAMGSTGRYLEVHREAARLTQRKRPLRRKRRAKK